MSSPSPTTNQPEVLHSSSDSAEFPLRVLIVTSELTPYARVGGLADMVSALSASLARKGVDVRVLLPRYETTDLTPMYRIPRPVVPEFRGETWPSAILQSSLDAEPRVKVYHLDRRDLFERSGVYADEHGAYADNSIRFGVLCAAAFALCRSIAWTPHIFHAHDWPTAEVVARLKGPERLEGFIESRAVLTVHNLAHHGPRSEFADIPRPAADSRIRREEAEESVLAVGIAASDRTSFVSPGFASEALSEGVNFRLGKVLETNRHKISGILNGVDYRRWDPQRDRHLVENYNDDSLDGKQDVRHALLAEFGMNDEWNLPLFGMIGRLDIQKGFEELLNPDEGCLEPLLKQNRFSMIVLGAGENRYGARLQELAARYANFAVCTAFDDALAHRIQGGSDFLLMPSRFEPCGLIQIVALRYGTIPVVTRTGGLRDTVSDASADGEAGTGIVIPNANPSEITEGIERALALWQRGPTVIARVRRRGMKEQYDADTMAGAYLELYKDALTVTKQD